MILTLNNGVHMPALGYGSYSMGAAEVAAAIKAGFMHIDTAEAYENEEEVAEGIALSGLDREEIFITTKISNGTQRAGNVEEAFEQCLKRLKTDYVDLLLIHWPVPEKYIDTWKAFEKIYKTEKVRAIGVSNFQDYHLAELKKVWEFAPVTNQVELHPRLTQKPLIELCKGLGITITAWSPLGSDKADLLTHPTIAAIGAKYGKTTAQTILRWCIDQGVATLPRSKTPKRMDENINIFDFALTPDEIAQIDALNQDLRTGPDPDNFNF